MTGIAAGDRVRQKHNRATAAVLEVSCGGARLRYDDGGPYGKLGQRIGVWEHLIDLEPA